MSLRASICLWALFVVPVAVAAPPSPQAESSASIENSVVKIFSTVRYPDVSKPWTKQAPTEITAPES